MNEALFFLHVALVFLCTLGSLKIGKSALKIWICLSALFANFFVLKQIILFGLQVTCSDAFAIGGIFGLNLLREYYGTKSSLQTIKLCFYTLIAFALFSQIHLLYLPSSDDCTSLLYKQLLAPAPRLLIASLLVFYIVQKIDLSIFGKLSTKNIPFVVRNSVSLFSSQLLDTILFTFIGLYGIIESPLHVICVSFLIKAITIACLTPMTLFTKKVFA
jgi:uncharacterized integral membrane protein (TIGR00697 family)